MDMEVFTEAYLKKKKYGELIKIAKQLGVRSSGKAGGRIKTTELIELIIKSQSQDVNISENSPDDLDAPNKGCSSNDKKSEASAEAEELLSDIQFPDESEDEEISKVEIMLEGKVLRCGKRRRTPTYDLAEDAEDTKKEDDKIAKNHNRTGTYEVSEDADCQNDQLKPKRRRTSTFEVDSSASENVVEENTQNFQELCKRLSDGKSASVTLDESKRRSSRSRSFVIDKSQDEASASQAPEETSASHMQEEPSASKTPTIKSNRRLSRSRSFVIDKTQDEASASQAPEETSASHMQEASASKTPTIGKDMQKRKSIVPKPATNTPKIARPEERKIVNSAIRNSARKYVLTKCGSVSVTPKSVKRGTPGSKIMKPLFTVGKGDTATKGEKIVSKPGTGIPRFITFASKIKLPNFAKIHEKAFKRMEALDDYVDKKRKAAENPASETKKPRPIQPASGEIFKPAVTSVDKLDFNFTGNSCVAEAEKTQVAEVVKAKPAATKTVQASAKFSAKKSPKFNGKLRSPKVHTKNVSGSVRKNSCAGKGSPRARYHTLPRPIKENVKPGRASISSPVPRKSMGSGNTPGSIQKRREYDPKANLNKPVKYVPYTGALKPINSAATHKTLAKRLPNVKTIKERREDQRNILKGVRFNKRFELQMAKRGVDITK